MKKIYVVIFLFTNILTINGLCFDSKDDVRDCAILPRYGNEGDINGTFGIDFCTHIPFLPDFMSIEKAVREAQENGCIAYFIPDSSSTLGKGEFTIDNSDISDIYIPVYAISIADLYNLTGQNLIIIDIDKNSNQWYMIFKPSENPLMILWYIAIICAHGIPTIYTFWITRMKVKEKGWKLNMAFIILVSNFIGSFLRLMFVLIDPVGIRQIVSSGFNSILGLFSIPWQYSGYILIGLYWYKTAKKKIDGSKIIKTWIKVLVIVIIYIILSFTLLTGILQALYVRSLWRISSNYFLGFIITMLFTVIGYIIGTIVIIRQMKNKNENTKRLKRRIIKSSVLNTVTTFFNLFFFMLYIFSFIRDDPTNNITVAGLIAVALGANCCAQVYHFDKRKEIRDATKTSKNTGKSTQSKSSTKTQLSRV